MSLVFSVKDLYVHKETRRLPYRKRNNVEKSNVHWGQRKLFLSEVEFFSLYWNVKEIPNPLCVYAGSAPGQHLPILSKMFPSFTFHLYDPSPFKIKETERIKIHQQYFNDDIASQYANRKDVFFLSDIRTTDHKILFKDALTKRGITKFDTNNNPVGPANLIKEAEKESTRAVETQIWNDMNMQQKWLQIINPEHALLKFRLPYAMEGNSPIVEYVQGVVFWQIWAPPTSTETRLKPARTSSGQYEVGTWDVKEYEEWCFYQNTVVREHNTYRNPFTNDDTPIDIPELTNDFDSVAESYILKMYTDKIGITAPAAKYTKVKELSRMLTWVLNDNNKGTLVQRRDNIKQKQDFFQAKLGTKVTVPSMNASMNASIILSVKPTTRIQVPTKSSQTPVQVQTPTQTTTPTPTNTLSAIELSKTVKPVQLVGISTTTATITSTVPNLSLGAKTQQVSQVPQVSQVSQAPTNVAKLPTSTVSTITATTVVQPTVSVSTVTASAGLPLPTASSIPPVAEPILQTVEPITLPNSTISVTKDEKPLVLAPGAKAIDPFGQTDRSRVENFVKYKFKPGAVDIIYSGLSNVAILDRLQSFAIPQVESVGQNKGRADLRLDDIKEWIDKYVRLAPSHPYYNYQVYLDVGAGEAKITNSIAGYLNLPKDRAWATDISPLPEQVEISTIQSVPDRLEFPDNSVLFITIFMALHHFSKLSEMIREIHRVLAPGGIVIIREHDARNIDDVRFYDLTHALYATVLNKEDTPTSYLENYFADYHSASDWVGYMQNFQFELLEPVKMTNDRFQSFYAILRRR